MSVYSHNFLLFAHIVSQLTLCFLSIVRIAICCLCILTTAHVTCKESELLFPSVYSKLIQKNWSPEVHWERDILEKCWFRQFLQNGELFGVAGIGKDEHTLSSFTVSRILIQFATNLLQFRKICNFLLMHNGTEGSVICFGFSQKEHCGIRANFEKFAHSIL